MPLLWLPKAAVRYGVMLKLSTKKVRELLTKTLFSPKVNDDALQERIEELRRKLPTPVFWLLGKTQSGKTSIIRALTGRDDAEIGNGFQACTRTARIYDFPTAEDCLLRFLDTRGLGEADYDPTADMQVFAQQAHLLIVVMKAMDHAQADVLAALHIIRKSHPEWPIIVVQTTLHEGYPTPTMKHIDPYPYAISPWPRSIPEDVVRSLLKQREWFHTVDAQFVVVDFTLPDDNLTPLNYGIDALWTAIERALPLGLRALLQATGYEKDIDSIYFNAAYPHIVTYAILAGSAELIPVPLVSVPLVISLQAKMLHAVASIYQQTIDWQTCSQIASALGVGYLLRWGGREAVKIIPLYGSALSSVYIAAVTYALGKVLCAYFVATKKGLRPDQSMLEKIYAEEMRKGRDLLTKYVGAIRR
jgi:uncharacterized protein (DUF697 family)